MSRSKRTRRRAGRPRKAQAKNWQPNGEPRTQPAISPETIARRTVTGKGDPSPLDPKCGYALGRLYMEGHVTEGQHDAGRAFWMLERVYRRLIDGPNATARAAMLPYVNEQHSAPLSGAEVAALMLRIEEGEEAEWPRIRDAFEDSVARIKGRTLGDRIYTAVWSVCVDDVYPRWVTERMLVPLRVGLMSLVASGRVNGT